ncbi:transposable element Tcb1 transposase [Trichonephila clavipes]|nr:transposable element Tcb1 transposase [Trichonephila clavipes]
MSIVFVCGDHVVNASILPLLYSDTLLHSWSDGMGCYCLQYTVTPSIDPLHYDIPAVCSWHPATICVATYLTAPRSHFSTRQFSVSHGKDATRLSPHCYYPSLVCPIPRFVSNRAYLGSFGTASWASYEFEWTRGKVTADKERNISRHYTELVCLNARSYRVMHSR